MRYLQNLKKKWRLSSLAQARICAMRAHIAAVDMCLYGEKTSSLAYLADNACRLACTYERRIEHIKCSLFFRRLRAIFGL